MFDKAPQIGSKVTEEQHEIHSRLLESSGLVPEMKTASTDPFRQFTQEGYNFVPPRFTQPDGQLPSNKPADTREAPVNIEHSTLKQV